MNLNYNTQSLRNASLTFSHKDQITHLLSHLKKFPHIHKYNRDHHF
jgi:hypothetical protein